MKQWERLGCYKEDCVGGTGDGGGENEGADGVHALMEDIRPDYVRRRCLAHLPWRCADQVLACVGEQHDEIKAISYYLHDSGTWNRLKAIAVQTPACGGFGLLSEGSPAYHGVFSKAPPRNMGERPNTTVALLVWLQPRAGMLARLVAHDFALRDLQGKQNRLAHTSLVSAEKNVLRRITCVNMKKVMYVYYHIEKTEHVSTHTSLDGLFQKATKILTSTECDAYTLDHLGLPADYIATQGLRPDIHWVEVALRTSPRLSAAEQDELLPSLYEFNEKIVYRAQGHMGLNLINIFRTTWTSATMLNPDPQVAQEAANKLLWQPSVGLLRLRPDQCTPFERSLLANPVLMQQIENIATIKPAMQLWRGNGYFKDLLYFLANRFLGAPDHVLDAESVHAQWKWIEVNRRAIKFKLLNAIVKLRFFVFTNRRLPPSEQLRHQVEEIQRGHLARYNALVAGGDMHPAMLRDAPYLSRFNLRATDATLIRDVDRVAAGKPNSSAKSLDLALSNYIRFLFKPQPMYFFQVLTPATRRNSFW